VLLKEEWAQHTHNLMVPSWDPLISKLDSWLLQHMRLVVRSCSFNTMVFSGGGRHTVVEQRQASASADAAMGLQQTARTNSTV
jgi:hypothetical protein